MKYTKLKNNVTGEKAPYLTLVKTKVTKKNLVFKFIAFHCSKNSSGDTYNSKIYNGDVIEAFFSTGEEGKYFEFEVAPNKTMFFAKISNVEKTITNTEYIEKNFANLHYFSLGNCIVSRFSFPLDKIGFSKEKGIEFNAYRIETDGEKPDKHLMALFPTNCGSFHVRSSLKKLV